MDTQYDDQRSHDVTLDLPIMVPYSVAQRASDNILRQVPEDFCAKTCKCAQKKVIYLPHFTWLVLPKLHPTIKKMLSGAERLSQ